MRLHYKMITTSTFWIGDLKTNWLSDSTLVFTCGMRRTQKSSNYAILETLWWLELGGLRKSLSSQLAAKQEKFKCGTSKK